MRLRNSEQALKELPGPVTARISKERGRGGREEEDRRRGREREKGGKTRNSLFSARHLYFLSE